MEQKASGSLPAPGTLQGSDAVVKATSWPWALAIRSEVDPVQKAPGKSSGHVDTVKKEPPAAVTPQAAISLALPGAVLLRRNSVQKSREVGAGVGTLLGAGLGMAEGNELGEKVGSGLGCGDGTYVVGAGDGKGLGALVGM